MTTRGGDNLALKIGIGIATNAFYKFEEKIKNLLDADKLEHVEGSYIDKGAGIDAVARKEGYWYAISLRWRGGDFNSFTINRHITEYGNEASKWMHPNALKPHYHIQIAEEDTHIRYIFINVEAFSYILEDLYKNNLLDNYYNKRLGAYEFSLKEFGSKLCIWTKVETK